MAASSSISSAESYLESSGHDAAEPRGEGPFPALVECHGGAWCLSDRTTERLRHEAMAKNGIVSIALDFR
jgi:acetyl esterase/lipase